MLKVKLTNVKFENFKNAEEYWYEVLKLMNKLWTKGEEIKPKEEFLCSVLPKSLSRVRAAAMANLHLNADVSSCRNLVISEAYSILGESRSQSSVFAVETKVYYKCGRSGHVQCFWRIGNVSSNNNSKFNYFRGNNNCNFKNDFNNFINNSNMSSKAGMRNNKDEIKCFCYYGAEHRKKLWQI